MPARGIRAQGNELLSITLWVTPQLHLLLLWAGTSSPGEEVHGRQQAGKAAKVMAMKAKLLQMEQVLGCKPQKPLHCWLI